MTTPRRVLAALLIAVSVALAAFLGLSLAGLGVFGLGRADAGDAVWTAAGGLLAVAGIAWGRALWRG